MQANCLDDHPGHYLAMLHGLHVFSLPVQTEQSRISLVWHPRIRCGTDPLLCLREADIELTACDQCFAVTTEETQ